MIPGIGREEQNAENADKVNNRSREKEEEESG
jgi:hypothetical protein